MRGVSYPEVMRRRFTKLGAPFHIIGRVVVVEPPGGVEAARHRAGIYEDLLFPRPYLPGASPQDV
jgi:hypothetical protein